MASDEDKLARARANRRELAWVSQRLADARAERQRLAEQLAISEQARDYEQADVDRLTRGVGRFFRMAVDIAELTKEQQELAAAQLLVEELSEELRAVDVDLEQLERRRRTVANAEAEYEAVLRDLESAARAKGHAEDELDALAETEAELHASRREIAEMIGIAIDVQGTFQRIVDLAKEMYVKPHDDVADRDAIIGIVNALSGHSSRVFKELSSCIAIAQQGLLVLGNTWSRHAGTTIHGPPMLQVELPSVGSLITRDILWTNNPTLDSILGQVHVISSALSTRVGELRQRDAAYVRALAECTRMREHLVAPNAAPYR